jgi:hypothetical protein
MTNFLAITLALVVSQMLIYTNATAQESQSQLVASAPMANTPTILDGRVFALARVGDTMLAGGSFTQVKNANNSTVHDQPYVLAFDATTGTLRTAFAPRLNGQVETLAPGPTPGTVYVGGRFTTLDGAPGKGLLLLNVATGTRVASFRLPPANGAVTEVGLSQGKLFVGGNFTTVDAAPHAGLIAVNPLTGALDPFVQTQFTERHNQDVAGSTPAPVGVKSFSISPDGSRMAVIGNFRKVDGLPRDQVAMLDLSGSQASVRADWRTQRYAPFCGFSIDAYVRDVDFSPDGSYFVIVAVGGGHAGTLCDSAARFETHSSGDDINQTWVDFTGADSLLSVAITGTAVYIGGHQRWLNNADGKDRPKQGAVPRPGLAALDPVTGLPFQWNPGRNPRGAGAYSLLATSDGLWMGSDTDYIGNRTYFRGKIAFFPLAGGNTTAALDTPSLPGNVYFGGQAGGNQLVRRTFDGTTTGAANSVSSGMDWSAVRGAFVVGNIVYYGKSNATFAKRSLVNGQFGPEILIDPYNDPYWSNVKSGSGTAPFDTYRGIVSGLYPKFPSVTSLFYRDQRVYYTVSGDSHLYYRTFNPESGILSATVVTVPATTLPAIRGAFIDGGYLYYVLASSGRLDRKAWVNGAPSGAEVTVSGPAKDGVDWRANALFIAN